MPKETTSSEVAIIGAGPYGLATAAHLRAVHVETRVFGEPMEFWSRNMPQGMLLRSRPECSEIGTPHHDLSLERFFGMRGVARPARLAREDFVRYGLWIQGRVAPDVDSRRVSRLEWDGTRFGLRLADGTLWTARRVVVATGIGRFARRPPEFDELPATLASHTSEPQALAKPRGLRVVVIGGGQSAFEAAADLVEQGADVEMLLRARNVRWLRSTRELSGKDLRARAYRIARAAVTRAMRPNLDIMGPRVVTWLVALPRIYRYAPAGVRSMLTRRAVRPAVADWMQPRLTAVRVTTGRTIAAVTRANSHLELRLDDGTTRRVDHAVLATGYRIDVRTYDFLSEEIRDALRVQDGYPILETGFESSVPHLHFLGAPAALTFGPICRFVVGTGYTGRAITRHVVRAGARRRSPEPRDVLASPA
jgi:FAD-dependent urate hydroxylase